MIVVDVRWLSDSELCAVRGDAIRVAGEARGSDRFGEAMTVLGRLTDEWARRRRVVNAAHAEAVGEAFVRGVGTFTEEAR